MTDREKKETRKEKNDKRKDGETNSRKKERGTRTKRWALEWAVLQIAPPALETLAHLEASARLKLKSAEFLTRARTSNDRDVIGRTWARKPCTSSFTWHAPGPGSEAAFREENFYRVARIERKSESESSLLHV